MVRFLLRNGQAASIHYRLTECTKRYGLTLYSAVASRAIRIIYQNFGLITAAEAEAHHNQPMCGIVALAPAFGREVCAVDEGDNRCSLLNRDRHTG